MIKQYLDKKIRQAINSLALLVYSFKLINNALSKMSGISQTALILHDYYLLFPLFPPPPNLGSDFTGGSDLIPLRSNTSTSLRSTLPFSSTLIT